MICRRIPEALAGDPDPKVLKSIARHSGLSDAQLRAMVDRHGLRVVAKWRPIRRRRRRC